MFVTKYLHKETFIRIDVYGTKQLSPSVSVTSGVQLVNGFGEFQF